MKRLLQISINLALGSIIPITCWFCLGVILDKNLINIFSITYPLQFLYALLLHIFGTGANISKEKDNNKSVVSSSLILGSIISMLTYGLIAWNVEDYLIFMGYEILPYRVFTIYSILSLGLSTVFYLCMEKLYFEDKELKASKFCILFNILYFSPLICVAIITHNQVLSVSVSLVILAIYTIIVFYLCFEKSKFSIHLFHNLKYESSTICSDILFFLIFLFGLKNANSFGIEYIAAINFVALITDTQWDALGAVTTVAKIDVSKKRFHYKKHLKQSYILTSIIVSTSIIMLFSLYKLYNLEFKLILQFLFFELFNFVIWTKYAIDNVLIQLNHSTFKSTLIQLVANVIRFVVSLCPTPFCTAIGQVISSVIQFVSYGYIKNKYCKTN